MPVPATGSSALQHPPARDSPRVLPPYALPDAALLSECDEHRGRAGGPGGQHANRTEGAVRLLHRASGVEAACSDHRSQGANRASALGVLRLRLALAVRGAADPAWLAPYVRGGRCAAGPNARDWHLIAACACDALAAEAGQLAPAAARLGLTTSQLGRLLARDPAVKTAADRLRAGHGLGPLHA